MNPVSRAAALNLDCPCESPALQAHSGFYSNVPVFVAAEHVRSMRSVIEAVHAIVALPAWQEAVLADAPSIARLSQRTHGVFAGFDFHVGSDGPKLIEINTNAGGAMLNAAAEWRHPTCCTAPSAAARVPASRVELETAFVTMFQREWRLARGDRPLTSIAIVDDAPAQQFLFAEFQLFELLFAAHGIHAFIADAAELELVGGRLMHAGRAIDLVYNRLTDFYFEHPSHAALRAAHETDAAVVTPHPRAHALFADKRNLARLTDAGFLRSIGARAADIEVLLSGVPRTCEVTGGEEAWWRDRKGWFFKPSSGYGSRGAYRGDKLTRRVFGEVLQGGYVAQELALPGERLRVLPSGPERFKVDLRCYVYDGALQLLAARLYQGQTTNFRTAGGGFAPVIELL